MKKQVCLNCKYFSNEDKKEWCLKHFCKISCVVLCNKMVKKEND